MKKNLHLILQGKGGVGKSYIAVHFAQFLRDHQANVRPIDVDANNNTIHEFTALNAARLDLLDETNPHRIHERKFDTFVDLVEEAGEGDHIVVDVGSSTIKPFLAHLKDLDFFALGEDLGFRTFVHIPITGGQMMLEDIASAVGIHEDIGTLARYMVWANPYFGPVRLNGRALEELPFFDTLGDDCIGIVHIPTVLSDPLAEDIQDMMQCRATYAEVRDNPRWKLPARARLHRYRKNFWAVLDHFLPTLTEPAHDALPPREPPAPPARPKAPSRRKDTK